jgi:phosphatidylglycerol---prolipoprotein diacylglyceryl transferase
VHPILFEISANGVTRWLGSYGACVALGVVVASALSLRATQRARMDVGLVFVQIAAILAGGFAGAWLMFLAIELARTGTFDALAHGGGFVFFGAPIGGFAGAMIAARFTGIDVVRGLDVSVPALAAGHAMGRLGCLLGGCCYGAPWDGAWSIVYTHPLAPASHPSVPRHPAPLYESIALLAVAMIFALAPMRLPRGGRIALYLGVYCTLRFAIEIFRGDAVRGVWLGGISSSQIFSIAGFVIALAALAALARRAQPE